MLTFIHRTLTFKLQHITLSAQRTSLNHQSRSRPFYSSHLVSSHPITHPAFISSLHPISLGMTPKNHYRCALCRGRYTRRNTVHNHFPGCVRRNGNPDGLVWDSDPSCWRRGADGPSLGPVQVS